MEENGRSEFVWYFCRLCRRVFAKKNLLLEHKKESHRNYFDKIQRLRKWENPHQARIRIKKEEEEGILSGKFENDLPVEKFEFSHHKLVSDKEEFTIPLSAGDQDCGNGEDLNGEIMREPEKFGEIIDFSLPTDEQSSNFNFLPLDNPTSSSGNSESVATMIVSTSENVSVQNFKNKEVTVSNGLEGNSNGRLPLKKKSAHLNNILERLKLIAVQKLNNNNQNLEVENTKEQNQVISSNISNHPLPLLPLLPISSLREKTFECGYCQKVLASKQNLQNHIKRFHTTNSTDTSTSSLSVLQVKGQGGSGENSVSLLNPTPKIHPEKVVEVIINPENPSKKKTENGAVVELLSSENTQQNFNQTSLAKEGENLSSTIKPLDDQNLDSTERPLDSQRVEKHVENLEVDHVSENVIPPSCVLNVAPSNESDEPQVAPPTSTVKEPVDRLESEIFLAKEKEKTKRKTINLDELLKSPLLPSNPDMSPQSLPSPPPSNPDPDKTLKAEENHLVKHIVPQVLNGWTFYFCSLCLNIFPYYTYALRHVQEKHWSFKTPPPSPPPPSPPIQNDSRVPQKDRRKLGQETEVENPAQQNRQITVKFGFGRFKKIRRIPYPVKKSLDHPRRLATKEVEQQSSLNSEEQNEPTEESPEIIQDDPVLAVQEEVRGQGPQVVNEGDPRQEAVELNESQEDPMEETENDSSYKNVEKILPINQILPESKSSIPEETGSNSNTKIDEFNTYRHLTAENISSTLIPENKTDFPSTLISFPESSSCFPPFIPATIPCDSFKSLSRHFVSGSRKNRYTCTICHLNFDRPSHAFKHSRTHTSRPFQCQGCDMTFRVKGTLDIHRKRRHRQSKLQSQSPPNIVNSSAKEVEKTFVNDLDRSGHLRDDFSSTISNSIEVESTEEVQTPKTPASASTSTSPPTREGNVTFFLANAEADWDMASWTTDESDPEDDGGAGESGQNGRYCICQKSAFGYMIGCDNKSCPVKWFHSSCVGLNSAPKDNWYCDQCSDSEVQCIPLSPTSSTTVTTNSVNV